MKGPRGCGGFTLVELLMALLVLEVGLLGVVGTLLLAARTLADAEARERAVTEVRLVQDSLAGTAGAGEGTRSGPWGALYWTRGPHGDLHLRVEPRGGVPWSLRGWVGEGGS